MAYTIRANNTDYEVRQHAADNMRQRFISEEMVIKTLEKGELTEQAHGHDLYEFQYFDEDFQSVVIIQVVVNPAEKAIITVIDDTQPKAE